MDTLASLIFRYSKIPHHFIDYPISRFFLCLGEYILDGRLLKRIVENFRILERHSRKGYSPWPAIPFSNPCIFLSADMVRKYTLDAAGTALEKNRLFVAGAFKLIAFQFITQL